MILFLLSSVITYTNETGKRNVVSDSKPYLLVGYNAQDLELLVMVWRHRS